MADIKTLRTFGFIWSAILLIAAYKFEMNPIILTAAAIFLITSSLRPTLFTETHVFQTWIKFGNFMGKINSKIIIFLLFFFVFTPVGIFLRLLRKDLLRKKWNKDSETYFVKRVTQPGSMSQQF